MNTTSIVSDHRPHRPDADDVVRLVARRSFATLATVSAASVPHVAAVLYELVDEALYINTLSTSRKARNIASSGRAAIVVPVRRVPVGPPSSIQFQTTGEVLSVKSPFISRLLEEGHLRSLTKHGELELPDGCFLRLPLPARLVTHGVGMSLRQLVADPIGAGGFTNTAAR